MIQSWACSILANSAVQCINHTFALVLYLGRWFAIFSFHRNMIPEINNQKLFVKFFCYHDLLCQAHSNLPAQRVQIIYLNGNWLNFLKANAFCVAEILKCKIHELILTCRGLHKECFLQHEIRISRSACLANLLEFPSSKLSHDFGEHQLMLFSKSIQIDARQFFCDACLVW